MRDIIDRASARARDEDRDAELAIVPHAVLGEHVVCPDADTVLGDGGAKRIETEEWLLVPDEMVLDLGRCQ